MQYIILIGDETLTLNSIKAIKHYDSKNCYDVVGINERYCVDYGTDHIFYDYIGDNIDGFEESDYKKIPFEQPHFIMLIYNSEERIKKVIQQKNYLRDIYVDNDYGLVVPIEKFIKLNMPLQLVK